MAAGNTVVLNFVSDVDKFARGINLVTGALGGVAAGGVAVAASLAAVPIALGAVAAAALIDGDVVKAQFSDLDAHIKSTAKSVTESMIPQLKNMASTATSIFDSMAASFTPVLQDIASNVAITFAGIAPALKQMFADAAPSFKLFADGVLGLVQNLVPGLQALSSSAAPVVKALSDGLSGLGTALSDMFTSFAEHADGAAAGLTAFFDLINGIIPVVGDVLGVFADWSATLVPIAGVLLGIALAVKAVQAGLVLLQAGMAAVRIATTLWAGAQWLLSAALSANPIGLVIAAVAALVAAFIWCWHNVDGFADFFRNVWANIKNWASNAASWVVTKVREIGEWFGRLPSMITGALAGAGNWLVNTGRNLLIGLWNGIAGAASWLYSNVRNFFAGLLPGWARDFLGIHSPSRVFAEMGKQIPAGLAVGIGNGMGMVKSAIGDMSDAASSSVSFNPTAASVSSSTAGQQGLVLEFDGDTDSAVASMIAGLVRTGKLKLKTA